MLRFKKVALGTVCSVSLLALWQIFSPSFGVANATEEKAKVLPAQSGLFGSQEAPTEKADKSVNNFYTKMKDSLAKLDSETTELANMSNITFADAKAAVEKSSVILSDLLARITTGGEVDAAIRSAQGWMIANRTLVAGTRMPLEQQRVVYSAWSVEIQRMADSSARLNVVKTQLEEELRKIDGNIDYLSHVELIRTAKAMNESVIKVIAALQESLDNLRQPLVSASSDASP